MGTQAASNQRTKVSALLTPVRNLLAHRRRPHMMQTQEKVSWLRPALALPDEPTVHVAGYAYLVDMGREVKPRLHTVHKDRSCNCGDPNCPAVAIVTEWLTSGRIERAPEPPTGYTPYLPKSCPVCGAGVVADHTLSSHTRGIGWKCATGGAAHYWQQKWDAVKGWFFREEILPGIRRGQLITDAPMGYLPEANRCHVVTAHTLEMEGAMP
jgi:hypothetical protein